VARAEAELQETDPTIFITDTSNRAAIASSTSDLASTRATAAEARKAVDQLTAQLAQAEAANRTAQAERRRVESLAGGGAVPQAEVEALANAAEGSQANTLALGHALEAARDRVSAHGARVAMAASKVVELQQNAPRQMAARRASLLARQAALDLAKARLVRAELDLGYSQIRAPAAGIVGKKAVNVGDRVAPGQQIIAIAHVQDLWVTANFRETQLRGLASGQPAELYVDALAVSLPGTVESFGGATGARFSVLPPENATGNYVKVVQRIPVRIRFRGSASTLERLRPGMSVEARVQIR
jgi:membrane fusion protein (multidrug efflux system)